MGVIKVDNEAISHLTNMVESILKQKQEERRIGRDEFAHLLNIKPESLDRKIRHGLIDRPFKDGINGKSFWLSSYVQSVVTDTTNSAKIATN